MNFKIWTFILRYENWFWLIILNIQLINLNLCPLRMPARISPDNSATEIEVPYPMTRQRKSVRLMQELSMCYALQLWKYAIRFCPLRKRPKTPQKPLRDGVRYDSSLSTVSYSCEALNSLGENCMWELVFKIVNNVCSKVHDIISLDVIICLEAKSSRDPEVKLWRRTYL